MRFNRNLRARGIVSRRTSIQRAIAFLRSLGTNAHVWLPGANGVNVASLPSNNYLLSNGGTGYSTVDGVVGLDLDGMGSVGAESVSNPGPFTVTTGWASASAAAATSAVVGSELQITSTVGYGRQITPISTVVNATYKASIALRKVSGGGRAFVGWTTDSGGSIATILKNTASATEVTAEVFFVATSTTTYIVAGDDLSVAGTVSGVTLVSVKEYTGTHLTQPTTANKPLLRRGVFNELLNSATPATQSVTCIAAPYTLALYGTGNVVLSGTGAGTLTGTGASDLVVLNFTPTAGSVTFTKAGTVSSFGLFKGTWTAAQILAEGGIPTTTATAASNPSAGKYWWSLDGSNDSLLSGNLGITTACTIVIAGRVNSLATLQMLFAENTGGASVYVLTNGSIAFSKTDTGTITASAVAAIVAGVPFVITVRLSGGTAIIRLNGVQITTVATAETFTATTGARVGTSFDGTSNPTGGALGWVVPIAAALSDTDCLTVERLVAAQFPGMSTVDGDANAILLEDGSGFLTMETGDLLLLE